MNRRVYKILVGLCFIALASCAQLPPGQEWSSDLPHRDIFTQNYQQDTANQAKQTLNKYLFWVRQYYHGSTLQPQGWLEVSAKLVASSPAQNSQEITERLANLGLNVSSEWAKSNSVRKINTRNVSGWATALQEAILNDELLSLLDRIEPDVDALIAGSLLSKQIDDERYYASEYDEFF